MRRLRRLLLRSDPPVEVPLRLNYYADQHVRVLGPAILGTIAKERALPPGIDPHVVDAIWNQVSLPRNARHPEAVDYIGRLQFQQRHLWRQNAARWNVQLIRGD